jgi:hypothetical protein
LTAAARRISLARHWPSSAAIRVRVRSAVICTLMSRSTAAISPAILEVSTLLFGNESLRAGHAEKRARWQDLLAPLIGPRLPESEHRSFEARAITAAATTCLQAAHEEWVRLGGRADLFGLYDAAVRAIRRPA